jgi:hypothetical protein
VVAAVIGLLGIVQAVACWRFLREMRQATTIRDVLRRW